METSAVLKTILNIFITACRNIEVYEEEEEKKIVTGKTMGVLRFI